MVNANRIVAELAARVLCNQRVDSGKERGQGLTAARRRGDQRVVARLDAGPALDLRLSRAAGELLLEPLAHKWVKAVQHIGSSHDLSSIGSGRHGVVERDPAMPSKWPAVYDEALTLFVRSTPAARAFGNPTPPAGRLAGDSRSRRRQITRGGEPNALCLALSSSSCSSRRPLPLV